MEGMEGPRVKVLVTGCEGYIGIVLAQYLLEKGIKVDGFDTGFYKSGLLYKGTKIIPKIISKDIRKISTDDLKGYDVVVHLAELSNDPLGEFDSKVTYKINHLGTTRLAKNAKKAGVKRFIYYSSCSVYGASDNIVSEESKVNPITQYAICKVLNEKMLAKLASKNFTPVFLRNATVFGASPRFRFDLVVNNLTGLAWTKRKIEMSSDGTPWRPLVHILDVCQATYCVLKAPKKSVYKQIFNVGSNKSNYQIKDIANIILEVFPGCKITFNKNSKDKRNYRVNFDKINNKLPSFYSQHTLRDGIKELLDIYKKIELKKETFDSKNYTRMKQIEHLSKTKQVDKDLFWGQ